MTSTLLNCLEELRSLLLCHGCQGDLGKEPVMLVQCGHSICSECCTNLGKKLK